MTEWKCPLCGKNNLHCKCLSVICHNIALMIVVLLTACSDAGADNPISDAGIEPPQSELFLPFSDCDGHFAGAIIPMTEHPDTGLCTFECIREGTTKMPYIEKICTDMEGACLVDESSRAYYCVPR